MLFTAENQRNGAFAEGLSVNFALSFSQRLKK